MTQVHIPLAAQDLTEQADALLWLLQWITAARSSLDALDGARRASPALSNLLDELSVSIGPDWGAPEDRAVNDLHNLVRQLMQQAVEAAAAGKAGNDPAPVPKSAH